MASEGRRLSLCPKLNQRLLTSSPTENGARFGDFVTGRGAATGGNTCGLTPWPPSGSMTPE